MPKDLSKKIPEHQIPLPAVFHKVAMIVRTQMKDRIVSEKWVPKEFRQPCVAIMHSIGRMSPVSQKEIAAWLGMDPSDIVTQIDVLEKLGLVNRTRDTNDRRRQLLTLTNKGEELRGKLQQLGEDVIREVLSPLNDKEVEIFRQLLQRVLEHHQNNESN